MTESVGAAGRNITVRQLEMCDVREVIKTLESMAKDKDSKPHIVDVLFDDTVPAKALALATGLSMDELAGKFNQDEIRELLDKTKSVNPFFVGMMERITAKGERLIARAVEESRPPKKD